jgi:filamentous hemagglutinin family protein
MDWCKMKKQWKTAFASVLCLSLMPGMFYTKTYGLPQGYESISGDIRFTRQNNTLNVTTTANRSIARYQSFNIGRDETVNFQLPQSYSAILNRVVGGDPSQILGTIRSNGQVFLVNPSGILFGSTAQVMVGSLFASTLSISDQDFLDDRLVFKRPAGSSPGLIRNEGSIAVSPGGFVVLSAGAIENTGSISAPQGQLHLAVGDRLTVQMDDSVFSEVVIDETLKQKVDDLQSAITNTGTLQADDGKILLQTMLEKSVYEKSMNNEGLISAQGLETHGGEVALVANAGSDALVQNTGTINVSGGSDAPQGGKVSISGDWIDQKGSILAEGAEGGDGGRIELNSGKATLLATGSLLSVKESGEHGDAGSVWIWSDGNTYFAPNAVIDARGGQVSGDGGFVEVSGKEAVYFQGTAYGGANQGKGGTIFIDPRDIIIANGGGDTPTTSSALAPQEDFTDDAGLDVTYDPSAGSTTFDGFTNIWLRATRDIYINSTFDTSIATTGATLTPVDLILEADNDINVNAAIIGWGGFIDLTADADMDLSGNVTIALAGSITNPGPVTIGGSAITVNGAIDAGSVLLLAPGNVQINNTVDGNGSVGIGGNAIIQGGTGMLISNVVLLDSPDIGTLGTPLQITAGELGIAPNPLSEVFLHEQDGVAVDGTSVSVFSLTAGGDVQIDLTTPLVVDQDVTIVTTNGGDIKLGKGITSTNGNIILTADGAISHNNGAEDLTSSHQVTLQSGGNIGSEVHPIILDVSNLVLGPTVNGDVHLRQLSSTNISGNFGNNFSLSSAGNLILTNSISTPGSVTLTADNSIVENGGTITASNAILRAGGAIGTQTSPVQVAVANTLGVDADGTDAGVSVTLAGSVGAGRPTVLDGNMPGLGLFNGILFYPDVNQGNATVAIPDVGLSSVGVRVFDSAQFSLASDLIDSGAGGGEEEDVSVDTSQGANNPNIVEMKPAEFSQVAVQSDDNKKRKKEDDVTSPEEQETTETNQPTGQGIGSFTKTQPPTQENTGSNSGSTGPEEAQGNSGSTGPEEVQGNSGSTGPEEAQGNSGWPSPIQDESDPFDVLDHEQPTGGYFTPEILPESKETNNNQQKQQEWKPVDTIDEEAQKKQKALPSDINWRY